jgi:hypothetical protein
VDKMIIIKDGVKIAGLDERMQPAIEEAERQYRNHEVDLVITSALRPWDRKSKHSKGLAIDLRTWNLVMDEDIKKVHYNLVKELKNYYDVKLEKDHIHIEWEPK